MTEDILRGLNEKQLAAVTATEGFVRVSAGAGSGKTRVLTSRYVYIAKTLGVSPEHILSVTFTNKAAREMRGRIRRHMPDEDGGWILTFHSACHKILKEDGHLLALPSNFMVLDEEDQKSVLHKIYTENGLSMRDFPFRKCLDAIELYKSKANYVPYLTDTVRAYRAPALPEQDKPNSLDGIIREYMNVQRKNFWLDFADLIQFVLYLLKTNAAARKKWQNAFEYIQIDEFQDVSGEQYALAKILSGKHKNLFIVGDPDQTIYSWRGADVKFFNNFPKDFPGTQTITLDINYRSTPQILSAANSLISKNTEREEKILKPTLPGGDTPEYFHCLSRTEEADKIADKILSLNEGGVPFSDIAVLFRSNYMSRVIEASLMRKKVPYMMFGGVEFYKRKEVKDALAYLRLAVFEDDLSFERIINIPPRGIGRKRMHALHEYAAAQNRSLFCALKAIYLDPLFKGTDASSFIRIIDDARQFALAHDPFEALDHVLTISGYEAFLRDSGGQDHLNNLNELKASAREFVQAEGGDIGAEEYLNSLSLISNADTEDKKEHVKLMTIHTAKGLEFPYVFICCMNEGSFPSRKIRDKAGMEEERRVAYVALTRAMRGLYLSDAEGFDSQSGDQLNTSRFVFEVGADNLNITGKLSKAHMKRSASYIESRNREIGLLPPAPKAAFSVNSSVYHAVFGIGTIKAISADGYTIAFENGKTRTLSLSAPLSPID